ncbi:hypothetical protein KM043_008151 [Ampulex compressa]|nr:hypothetical protein KM043_008151 [Ampulex compressa]
MACDELLAFDSFTDMIDEQINDVASALNWTVESITENNKNFLVCPYDSSHRLTEKSLEQHLARCQWKSEGYGETDLPLSEPGMSGASSIKFDVVLQNDILQRAKEENPSMNVECYESYTWHRLNIISFYISFAKLIIKHINEFDIKDMYFLFIFKTLKYSVIMLRLLTDFTGDERKALYEYVIANTVKPKTSYELTNIHDLKSEQKEDKELSFLELLIQERNLKRRRAKHKGVHTNKKSYTEILREVINQEMEIYVDYTKEKDTQSQKGRESRDSRTRENLKNRVESMMEEIGITTTTKNTQGVLKNRRESIIDMNTENDHDQENINLTKKISTVNISHIVVNPQKVTNGFMIVIIITMTNAKTVEKLKVDKCSNYVFRSFKFTNYLLPFHAISLRSEQYQMRRHPFFH